MKLFQALNPKFIEREVLVRGGAFRMRHQYAAEGSKNRYFFILNYSPQTDEILVVVTTTTQKHADAVPVLKKDYSELDQDSGVVFFGGNPMFVKRTELLSKIRRKEIQPLSRLPGGELDKLVRSALSAKHIDHRHKRLLITP
jgi:hypothetical protein